MSIPREDVRELMLKRETLDRTIQNKIKELDEMGVGMNQSLVDSEGYPIPNIDLYYVRSSRSQVRQMINDFNAITRQIEELLPSSLLGNEK